MCKDDCPDDHQNPVSSVPEMEVNQIWLLLSKKQKKVVTSYLSGVILDAFEALREDRCEVDLVGHEKKVPAAQNPPEDFGIARTTSPQESNFLLVQTLTLPETDGARPGQPTLQWPNTESDGEK